MDCMRPLLRGDSVELQNLRLVALKGSDVVTVAQTSLVDANQLSNTPLNLSGLKGLDKAIQMLREKQHDLTNTSDTPYPVKGVGWIHSFKQLQNFVKFEAILDVSKVNGRITPVVVNRRHILITDGILTLFRHTHWLGEDSGSLWADILVTASWISRRQKRSVSTSTR